MYRKSTKALLGWSGGSFSHQHLNPNIGFVTLNVVASSWGTSQDTLVWKVSTSGQCSKNYFHYNSRYVSGWKRTPLTLTATEIVNSGLSKTPLLQLKSYRRTGFGAREYTHARVVQRNVQRDILYHFHTKQCFQVLWPDSQRVWVAILTSKMRRKKVRA